MARERTAGTVDNALYAFNREIAKAAAGRWRAQREEIDRNLDAARSGKIEDVESKERIAKRINRILGKVRAAPEESLPPDIKRLSRGLVTPVDADGRLLERVIGETMDFLSIAFLARGLAASRPVARLVTRLGGKSFSYGTGFMVSPTLLMTNNHVLEAAEVAGRTTAEFDYERDVDGRELAASSFTLEPARFFLTNVSLDFALVAVAPRAANGRALAEFGFCPLIGAEGKILKGDPINIVQHPKGRLKEIVVRENRLVDLPDADDGRFALYEADTEPGSSGSPVFNDDWEVVALHHSGVPRLDAKGNPLNRDGKPAKSADEIEFIGNEGIRVSRLVAFIRQAPLDGDKEALRAELLNAGNAEILPHVAPPTDSVAELKPDQGQNPERSRLPPRLPGPDDRAPQRPERTAGQVAMQAGDGISLTVPLTVTLTLGSPGATANVMPRGEAFAETSTVVLPEADYGNREGYEAGFLGFNVPMPEPTAAIADRVQPVEGGGIELRYHHYSVIMNRVRRLAFVSAVNIDSGAPVQFERKGRDRWFFDPRVPDTSQAGNHLYADNPFDRGHLTRRADAAWGVTEAEAKAANDDTFHWTNAAPQHEVFNQSSRANQRGVLLWGNLENHITEQAEAGLGRLSVFNGPIFRDGGRDADRLYQGLPIPREFWKVICYRSDAGTLAAVAFVLSQANLIRNLRTEDFEVGPYQPFQVRISVIEERTGLDFGRLRESDPLLKPGVLERFEEGTEIVAIDALERIVLG